MLSTKNLVFKKKTSKKVNRTIFRAICCRKSNIKEWSEVKTASQYENSFSSKFQQGCEIQRTSKRAKGRGTEISTSRQSRIKRDLKNNKRNIQEVMKYLV